MPLEALVNTLASKLIAHCSHPPPSLRGWFPKSHFLHNPEDTAPVAVVYSPQGHPVHPPDPAFALYVPIEHGVHSPMPSFPPVNPALQMQSARAVPPIDKLKDAGHFEHAERPIKLLYSP